MNLKKILFSEIFLIILISSIVLSLSFYYLFYYTINAPPGTIFPLVHNYNSDYNFYLHLIKQSKDGNWLFLPRYTPEAFPPRFVHFVFLVIGKIAIFLPLGLPLVYTLSRVFLAVSFLILIYSFIRLVYTDPFKRKLAFFLTVFGTGFWTVATVGRKTVVNRFLSFWTENDAIERFVYLPHHLAGKVLMITCLLFLYQSLIQGKNKYYGWAILFGLLAGLSSPFVFVNMEIVLGIAFVLFLLFHLRDFQKLKNMGLKLLLYIIITSPPLLYLKWVEHSSFPWTNYVAWEKILYPITYFDFFRAYGPNFILSLIAIPMILKKRSLIYLILLSWLAEPWLGVFFFSRFSFLTNIRFLSSSFFIPSGILAAEGIYLLTRYLEKFLKVRWKILSLIILTPLVFIFAVDIYTNIASQLKTFTPHYYNVFPPKTLFQAFSFLDRNTPKESVVLAQGFMGNLIPAYSHNKVVLGHQITTYRLDLKGSEVNRFFEQKDAEFAKDLIEKYRISYVFYSLDTPPPNVTFISQLNLNKIFENNSAKIYQVIQK